MGDEYLTPYYNDYFSWIQYLTYDITRVLIRGDNGFGFWLGNGRYKGRMGCEDRRDCLYGDKLSCFCEIEIEYMTGGGPDYLGFFMEVCVLADPV